MLAVRLESAFGLMGAPNPSASGRGQRAGLTVSDPCDHVESPVSRRAEQILGVSGTIEVGCTDIVQSWAVSLFSETVMPSLAVLRVVDLPVSHRIGVLDLLATPSSDEQVIAAE